MRARRAIEPHTRSSGSSLQLRSRRHNRILSALGNQAVQSGLSGRALRRRRAPDRHHAFEWEAEIISRGTTNSLAIPSIPSESRGAGGTKPHLPGGRPLASDVRDKLTPRLGISLDDVRVHSDCDAHAAAHALNAHAFTHGNHIVFAENHYRPRSADGERLLVHELTHVAQQRTRPNVPTVQRDGGLSELEERDRYRSDPCQNSLNWSDGGHWIGSGPEPDCGRGQRDVNACRNSSNWSDGGHWIGVGSEPDCRNAGTPGIALRQDLEEVGEAYWETRRRNRQTIIDIREQSTSDAEALAALFRAPMLDDGTAAGRLGAVLTATQHWLIPGLQTGISFGDTGFRSEFQDASLWPSSGNQVGHFLTAVRLGHDPSFLNNWQQRYLLDTDDDVETMALRLIVGHEQSADPGALGMLASIIPLPGRWGFEEQYHHASDADIENFRTGNLEAITVGSGSGNSMQDLALSYKGYILGQMIADGTLTTPEEIANWIEREVGAVQGG